ncbi:hypothetical protein A3Q56_06929 [Intoshia linei]|uniref:EF-hand domain-containing protein n=1 Tax=Intoshia linei TaxID=1819745 RepID=A0A177ATN0_9BILA|nr:hypothetical protein A3Q56_06929 [Intoshia linei]
MGNRHPNTSSHNVYSIFNNAQIEQWHSGFKKFCKKGKISRIEFLNIYDMLIPENKEATFYRIVFNKLEDKKLKVIDFNNLVTIIEKGSEPLAVSITKNGQPKEKLKIIFQLVDTNNNGLIDRKEFKSIIDGILEIDKTAELPANMNSERICEHIFKTFDINEDGMITLEEFTNGCLNDSYLYKLFSGSIM